MTSEKFPTFLQNLTTRPKAIIFDWDNTLVDTWPLIHTAIDTTMDAMGREKWGLQRVKDSVHKSMRESFPEIFGENWQQAGEIYKNTYRAIHLQIQFLPGAIALIDELEKMGILAFVVSNKIGATLRKEAAAVGVDKKFFAIIGSQDASYDKPDKSPVELALLGSGLDPQKDEIWFVGDTIADVECAYNSGCVPVIYGSAPGEISRTIPEKLLREGRNSAGRVALYFEHDELIEKLRGLRN